MNSHAQVGHSAELLCRIFAERLIHHHGSAGHKTVAVREQNPFGYARGHAKIVRVYNQPCLPAHEALCTIKGIFPPERTIGAAASSVPTTICDPSNACRLCCTSLSSRGPFSLVATARTTTFSGPA